MAYCHQTFKLFPASLSLVSGIPAGDGKAANLFYSVLKWYFSLCSFLQEIIFIFFMARVCWLLRCLCGPFCIFGRFLDSNPESSRSKQARFHLLYLPELTTHLPNLSTFLPNFATYHPKIAAYLPNWAAHLPSQFYILDFDLIDLIVLFYIHSKLKKLKTCKDFFIFNRFKLAIFHWFTGTIFCINSTTTQTSFALFL